MRYYYKIYGLIIQSDLMIEGALEIQPGEAAANIQVTIEKTNLPDEVTGNTPQEKNEVNAYMCKANQAWFRWYGYGSFRILNGNRIEYQLVFGADMRKISELILCIALFFVLYQRKMIIMHGSAIIWKGRTILLSGESGAGKSTLAESLLADGAGFLADDMVAIDDAWMAMPAYPQQKLCQDQITEFMRKNYSMVELAEDAGEVKMGVRMLERFCREPQRVDALVILQKDNQRNEPTITEITGSEKVKYVVSNLFKQDFYMHVGLNPEMFLRCVKFADRIRVFSLSRPVQGMTVAGQKQVLEHVLKDI